MLFYIISLVGLGGIGGVGILWWKWKDSKQLLVTAGTISMH